MGKQDDAKSGLLGKVAKFIKNPTVDWADLDRSGLPDSQLAWDTGRSHLTLKDMIQNKRRNDAVRKREFDMLRKISRKNKGQGSALDAMDLTSSYLSSQLLPDAENRNGEQKRKRTLLKIDEIEAQLSRSWFHKPGEPSTVPMDISTTQSQRPGAAAPARPPGRSAPMPPPAAVAHSNGTAHIPASAFASTIFPAGMGMVGQPRPPDRRSGARPSDQLPPEQGFNPVPAPDRPEPPVLTQTYQPENPKPAPKQRTLSGAIQVKPGEPAARASELEPQSQPVKPPASQPEPRRRASVYDNALEGRIEVVALRQDPEIEEAAINFANGDQAAAELALRKLVSAGSSRRQDVEVWLTLFDLYRVTGQSSAFDDLVSEFTALFGRSAPQWEHAQDHAISPKQHAAPQAAQREGTFTWASPAQINTRALTALTGATSRSAPPWRIDWRAVKTVEPDALPPLNQLLTQWADAPIAVQFLGGEELLALLAGQSPTENKNVNPAWWRVRLSLLRLMNAPGLFDQTALDYCITYEISPPAWTPPQSSYTPLTGDGQPAAPPADDAASAPAFAPTTIAGELLAATGVFEAALEGQILGSANQALAAIPGYLERIRSFDFDCRALRRVDFGAAGELLNWSIAQQGQGRTVTFHGVHRLLAAFFSVIGINAAAQVVLRKD